MSFANIIYQDSFSGSNISGSNGVYSTISNLTNTALNTGGIDISGNLISFTNNNIIFGGGGMSTINTVYSGRNALKIESNKTINTLINLGSLCGGGGGGVGIGSDGGAGGGGGGGGGNNNGGPGGNGLHEQGGNSLFGGGGGFNASGGSGTSGGGGLGSLAGGGGGGGSGPGRNANKYGGGSASITGIKFEGGGGAGGGSGGTYAGGGNGSGGGGGGGGIGIVNGGYSISNLGQITTLENQQGIGFGLGALFYRGTLPSTYNIIIQTNASFGQLFYTGWANINNLNVPVPGTLNNFGISALSSENLAVNSTYDAVLVNVIPSNTSGTTNGFTWSLNYVAPGQTNCKGNIVTIGNINYGSYDLTILSIPTLTPTTKSIETPSNNYYNYPSYLQPISNLGTNGRYGAAISMGQRAQMGGTTRIYNYENARGNGNEFKNQLVFSVFGKKM